MKRSDELRRILETDERIAYMGEFMSTCDQSHIEKVFSILRYTSVPAKGETILDLYEILSEEGSVKEDKTVMNQESVR